MKMHEIGSFMVRNYLLETQDGFIAIDTGYPGGLSRFIKRFERLAPLSTLRYIFLTHAHDDHAGFLNALLKRTQARVILHPAAEAELLRGENAILPGAGYSTHLVATFGIFKKDFHFPPVESALLAERAVYVHAPEDQPFKAMGLPLRILFLPGHTADSIGLLDEETGYLYAGDAAMNAIISRARHTIWIDDAEQFGASWDRMLSVQPTRILPSHGNPKLLQKHRDFMEGRRLLPISAKGCTPSGKT